MIVRGTLQPVDDAQAPAATLRARSSGSRRLLLGAGVELHGSPPALSPVRLTTSSTSSKGSFSVLSVEGPVGSASALRVQERCCVALEDSPVIRRRVAWSWPASGSLAYGEASSGANDAKRRLEA